MQYIGEATEIKALVKDATYNFVISSNCLEHVANPVKALKSWVDILKPGGTILLIVPNKKNNFDHRRPDTSFGHLLEDYKNEVTENDNTHYEEIISLHDLERDCAGDFNSFKLRSLKNDENRCFHHHIFCKECLVALFDYVQLDILFEKSTDIDHIILGRKK